MRVLGREIKAIIFDMDGTLIDSTSIWNQIDKDFFAKRGMNEVPPDYAQEVVHMGLEKGAIMTIERYGFKNDTVEGILKEWKDASIDQYKNKIQLKDGALKFLNYCKNQNVRIGLATANDAELYEPCLDRLHIREYFEVITDVNKAKEGKSSPKIYDSIINSFGVSREETMVLEDTITGLKTAYISGYFAIAVYDKASENIDDLKRKNSYAYVNSLDELINLN